MKYLLLLPLLALACSSSAAVSAPPSVPTATRAAILTPTAEGKVCALVIASEAVNVRDKNHKVIGQLSHGKIVTVESGVGDWWMVKGDLTGRVRSTYLEVVQCP